MAVDKIALLSQLKKSTLRSKSYVLGLISDITGKLVDMQGQIDGKAPASHGKHIPSGGSSGQILRWSADGTAVWGADNDTKPVNMKGATASAAGAAGYAPAPSAGAANRYLRSDGTWAVPPDNNTTYGAATQSAPGLMSAADKKKLDGVAAGANAYAHPGGSGNKHIPSGGASGQILRWSADGTAVWGADNDTKPVNMKGATASAAGAAGYAPAPAAGAANRYLRSDGTWAVPPDNNTTYGAVTQSAPGLMSAADKKKLDGVAAGANAYTHPSAHAASMITQDATHRFVTDTEKSAWNAKPSAVSVTIPITGWGSDSTAGYPAYYDITVAGVTVKDRANVTIAVGSLGTAEACGMCPTNETLAGKIRIRATSVPTATISAEYWIEKGKE